MRELVSIAALLITLSFGGGQAFAFQEMPAPPSEDPAEAAAKPTPQPDPLHLATPGSAEVVPQADAGGLNLFGYTVMPKLNFGLDVLYGQDQQQLQRSSPNTIDETSDLSVVGKVKRRF
jgi:hypothetical protein